MAALDESMGFGFGAIGGREQSINLGAIDWSPPPKRSHSASSAAAARATNAPSIVVDVTPADARAAELVRQANCAVSTKIKIKPGTTKPLAAVYGKLRKRWRHVDGVLVLGAGPAPHSLKYAFVSPEHSCAPTEIIAPSPVSSLGSQSARKATPRRSPRPRKVTASGPQRPSSDSSDDDDDDEEVRRLEAALAAAKAKKKRRRDGGSRSSSSLEMPRRSPRKHAGSTVPAGAGAGAAPRDARGRVAAAAAVAAAPGRRRGRFTGIRLVRRRGGGRRERRRRVAARAEAPEKCGERVAGVARGGGLTTSGAGIAGRRRALRLERRRAAVLPDAAVEALVLPRRRRGGERAAPPPARRAVAAAARRVITARLTRTPLVVAAVALEHDAPLLRGRDDVLVAQQGLVGDELERLDVLLHGREDDVRSSSRSPQWQRARPSFLTATRATFGSASSGVNASASADCFKALSTNFLSARRSLETLARHRQSSLTAFSANLRSARSSGDACCRACGATLTWPVTYVRVPAQLLVGVG